MFDDNLMLENDDEANQEVKPKVRKICEANENIHSSLNYRTIKAPPLVEYRGIESYCENKRGTSLLSCSDDPSTSGLNNLLNVGRPIVFKTPKAPSSAIATTIVNNNHYVFFSVEELSLVKSLENWTNRKVTVVGTPEYNFSSAGAEECFASHPLAEDGSWRICVETSLLKEVLCPQTLQQIFGELEILNGKPTIRVNFVRLLGDVDLPNFVESYKLMQKHIASLSIGFKKHFATSETKIQSSIKNNPDSFLNNTLDGYDFSEIERN